MGGQCHDKASLAWRDDDQRECARDLWAAPALPKQETLILPALKVEARVMASLAASLRRASNVRSVVAATRRTARYVSSSAQRTGRPHATSQLSFCANTHSRILYSIRLPVQRTCWYRQQTEICSNVGRSSFLWVIPDAMSSKIHPTI